MLVLFHAGVAKLADALALGASGAIHGGSSPLPGTEIEPGANAILKYLLHPCWRLLLPYHRLLKFEWQTWFQ